MDYMVHRMPVGRLPERESLPNTTRRVQVAPMYIDLVFDLIVLRHGISKDHESCKTVCRRYCYTMYYRSAQIYV